MYKIVKSTNIDKVSNYVLLNKTHVISLGGVTFHASLDNLLKTIDAGLDINESAYRIQILEYRETTLIAEITPESFGNLKEAHPELYM